MRLILYKMNSGVSVPWVTMSIVGKETKTFYKTISGEVCGHFISSGGRVPLEDAILVTDDCEDELLKKAFVRCSRAVWMAQLARRQMDDVVKMAQESYKTTIQLIEEALKK